MLCISVSKHVNHTLYTVSTEPTYSCLHWTLAVAQKSCRTFSLSLQEAPAFIDLSSLSSLTRVPLTSRRSSWGWGKLKEREGRGWTKERSPLEHFSLVMVKLSLSPLPSFRASGTYQYNTLSVIN